MEEIDIHAKLAQIETAPHFSMIFDGDTERAELIDHIGGSGAVEHALLRDLVRNQLAFFQHSDLFILIVELLTGA